MDNTDHHTDPNKDHDIDAQKEGAPDSVERVDPEPEKPLLTLQQVKNFYAKIKKHQPKIKKYAWVLFLLVPLFLTIFLRVQPVYYPWAESTAKQQVEKQAYAQITQQLKTQFPYLTDQEISIQAIQKIQIEKEKSAETSAYHIEVNRLSKEIRDYFQDERGQTYLFGIDSYQYYRYTKNVVENGHMGDEIRNGESYDTLMRAPKGKVVGRSLHPYFSAYVYKFVRFFKRDISLLSVFFLIPILISALTIIPIFFIARKFGGNIAGMIAGIYLAIQPSVFNKTVGGFADTDAYTIFFPLMIIWLYLEAFEAKTWKTRLGLMILTGVFVGLFRMAWTGWWMTGYLLVGTGGIYLLYHLVQARKHVLAFWKEDGWLKHLKKKIKYVFWENKKIQQTWVLSVCFILSSSIMIMIVQGQRFLREIELFIILPFLYLSTIGKAVKSLGGELWPNIYQSVMELTKQDYGQIVKDAGGFIFFLMLIAVIVILFVQHKRKQNFLFGTILLFWFLGMFFTAKTAGVRFNMHIVPSLALGVGIATGKFFTFILKKSESLTPHESKFYIPSKMITGFFILLLIGLALGFSPFPPYCDSGMCLETKNVAYQSSPNFDDQWYNALTKIKLESAPNAIINSWWDFGHFFKAIGERAVTFDGASQNLPQAYWMGRVLITPDEKESTAIIRMLNCGANTAYDTLREKDEALPTIKLVTKLLNKTKSQGELLLKKHNYSHEAIANITQAMYCDPPESYLLLSEDMLPKSITWAHFGLWDFEKAYLWEQAKDLPKQETIAFMQEKLGYSEEKAKKIQKEMVNLQGSQEIEAWIAPTSMVHSNMPCRRNEEFTLTCDGRYYSNKIYNNVIFEIDLNTKEAFIRKEGNKIHPISITWLDEQGFQERFFPNPGLDDVSIMLVKNGNSYDAYILEEEIGRSVHARLFFFEGVGLERFTLVNKEKSLATGNIQTWKVNWDIE